MPGDDGVSRADATVPLLDHTAPQIVRDRGGQMIVDDGVDFPKGKPADVRQVRVIEEEASHPGKARVPGRPVGSGESEPERQRHDEREGMKQAGRQPGSQPDPERRDDLRDPAVVFRTVDPDGDAASRPDRFGERLESRGRVGQMVQHAHREGVITRRRSQRQPEQIGLDDVDCRLVTRVVEGHVHGL